MKKLKYICFLVITLILFSNLFISCSTTDEVVSSSFITKRKYNKGYFVKLLLKKGEIKKLSKDEIEITENNKLKEKDLRNINNNENFLKEKNEDITLLASTDKNVSQIINNNEKLLNTITHSKSIKKKEAVSFETKKRVQQPEYIDVIYLKNGDIIKGTIIENAPNNYIKVEIAGGSIITIKYSDILKMTKEKVYKEETYNPRQKQYSQAKTEGLSLASFLESLLGLLIAGIIFGPIAIIFGIIGLVKINKNPEKWKGRGWAIAGIIIGFVDIIAVIIILALL